MQIEGLARPLPLRLDQQNSRSCLGTLSTTFRVEGQQRRNLSTNRSAKPSSPLSIPSNLRKFQPGDDALWRASLVTGAEHIDEPPWGFARETLADHLGRAVLRLVDHAAQYFSPDVR